MPRLKQGNATFAPTVVYRYILGEDGDWNLIETFEDATVRDNGDAGVLRLPQAMLRAYSNDPDFFGDEDYQDDNGIYVQTKKEAEQYARYYDSKKVQQYVMDCDGDIALKRIMATVVGKYSWGHASEDWTVLTVYNKEDDEWDGWGFGNEPLRFEKWSVRLRKED